MAAKKAMVAKKATAKKAIAAKKAGPTKIAKVVIFFMENHTTDNIASDVPGVNGNKALPLAPNIVEIGRASCRERVS